MSEQDRYGYDSQTHPSHLDPKDPKPPKPRVPLMAGRLWTIIVGSTFLAVILLALFGCVSLPDWGEPSPPLPTTTTTTTTLPAPPVTEPPHPCAECLAQGYPLCNQPPEMLKTGCCNQPPGEACYLIPPATPTPTPTPEPTPEPPGPTPTPTPPAPPQKNCEIKLPDYAVKVTTPEKIVGPKQQISDGVWVAVSTCPKDHCTAAELDALAPGANPKYVEDLRTAFCTGGPCFCYGLGSHAITTTYKGMLSDGDLENLAKRGAIDAYGRRVKTSDGGRTWYLVDHRGDSNELLYPAPYSYTYGGFCPNLIERACPEEPTPGPISTPTPPPITEGMGITIAITCAGSAPNCGVQETTGPSIDTGRVFRAPLRSEFQGYKLDASYYLNTRGNKIHVYDPRFPGPLTSWRQDVLFGDDIDCSDFTDHPEGMTITCRGVRYPKPEDDPGYINGTRNRFTACNAQGLCGSVTLEVMP